MISLILWNYWKADYNSNNRELNSVDWCEKFETQNVLGAWTVFQDIVNELCVKYIPLKKIKKKNLEKVSGLLKRPLKC